MNATIKKIGSSNIDALMYLTHKAIIGNNTALGKIIRDNNDPNSILL